MTGSYRKMFAILRDEAGATSIEYVMIAAVLSIAVLAGATLIGQKLSNTFTNVASNIK